MSATYPHSHWFPKLKRYQEVLGMMGVIAFLLGKAIRRSIIVRKRLPFTNSFVYLRTGTTDISVFHQIFHQRLYDCIVPEPKTIIDAGAYTGLSTLFFKSKYPNAQIVAIEPEPSNYRLLTRNVQCCRNVLSINAALTGCAGPFFLYDAGQGHHGFQVRSQPGDAEQLPLVMGITVDLILEVMSWQEVDILKMDIEGSEVDVFQSSEKWIEKCNVIMVELHDRLKPGCTEALEAALKGGVWIKQQKGEITFFVRKG